MNQVSRLASVFRHATMSGPQLSPPTQPLVVILGSTGTGKSDVSPAAESTSPSAPPIQQLRQQLTGAGGPPSSQSS